MTPVVKVATDPPGACALLAQDVAGAAAAAVKERGEFRWVLSGGSTPRGLYRLLADQYRDVVPWKNVVFYWGDERCVPPDHVDSNFAMAREALIDRLSVSEDRVHRIHGEVEPCERAASLYEAELEGATHAGEPRFDMILLGLGKDGHTASLFPRSLALNEREHLVAAVRDPGQPPFVPRVSLTLPALSSSRAIAFLITGTGKASVVAQVLESLPEGSSEWPASLVRTKGTETWYLDQDAASSANRFLSGPNRAR